MKIYPPKATESVADFYGYCERDPKHEIYPGTDIGIIFGHTLCMPCFSACKEAFNRE